MFQLAFPIPPSSDKINHRDSLISMGSCFAENMGDVLKEYKFNVLSNPFGTIYNPVSLSELLMDDLLPEATVKQKGIYYHWQMHGQVSALSEEELKGIVQEKRNTFQEALQSANWLILTLGSAYAYRIKSTGQLVANCHKVPQTTFTKELLSVEEMSRKLIDIIEWLSSHKSKLKIILTVSPVRHVRDGLIESNRSKARLIESAHLLCDTSEIVSYFPAYEILIDELRDYRFYSKDRVHPSDEAIEYVWKRFEETYFDNETSQFIKNWSQIRSALNHRPYHPESPEHQSFLRATIDKLNALAGQVDVSTEVSLLERQLL
jgi:hypothetical protein